MYLSTKLLMAAFKNSESTNDGHSKQSNFKYTTAVVLLNYYEQQKMLVTESFYSQWIIYINKHI